MRSAGLAAVWIHLLRRCWWPRAIGDRLTCIFVNNGVLRKDEFAKVQTTMREQLGLNVVAVDAGDRFLAKLAGVTDPETKRKVIGGEFISVFDDEAKKIFDQEKSAGEEIAWLVQGTLYPDVIESSSVKGPSQDDQESSQRRRAACRYEVEAD